MVWMRIRAELARSHQYPEGSHRHAYEFTLPLDDAGRFDQKSHKKGMQLCTVHRYWEGEGDAVGELLHIAPAKWVFSYDEDEGEDTLPHFTSRIFREGEYLSVVSESGTEHALRIVKVEPAPTIAHTKPR